MCSSNTTVYRCRTTICEFVLFFRQTDRHEHILRNQAVGILADREVAEDAWWYITEVRLLFQVRTHTTRPWGRSSAGFASGETSRRNHQILIMTWGFTNDVACTLFLSTIRVRV